MFAQGTLREEAVYRLDKQDTLLFSLLPVPYTEPAEGDSCVPLGSYSLGHVAVAPKSLSMCTKAGASATLVMATGKRGKSDRLGRRRLSPRTELQKE